MAAILELDEHLNKNFKASHRGSACTDRGFSMHGHHPGLYWNLGQAFIH